MKGDQFKNSLQRDFNESYWAHIPRNFVETIPQNINGNCVFVLNTQNRSKPLEKCRDARPWKRDSKTKWKNFNNVRYRNCSGSHKCLNKDCKFFVECNFANQLKFHKNFVCIFCGAIGKKIDCPVRKYIGINDLTANIFHNGIHTCGDRQRNKIPTELVSDAFTINPRIKPSQIQGHAILNAMREKRSWAEIKKTVKSLTNKKRISNEKIKQRRKIQPLGSSFLAVKDYKEFTDMDDELYVYKVDKN